MSTTVDERVVSMKFDNAQFERETRTTMSTLDKLKEKLNFSKSVDGLDDVNRAVKRTDLSPLGNAADAVRVKFSYLQGTVQNVLNNMVNSAISAGKNIVSALTVDPIKTGLQEYETKINAIQVIRANTMGKNTMEEITAALDELNTYADKTIYNFSQMTSNVGKFVAQGLDVKQATNAIQGMANLAAASGASAEDMSRATYQMSQALGGVIRKIDWNSLRNANMATTTLKETLMDIARVEGIDIDKMIKNKGVFEDTLEEGWLTGEMFTKAMNIYSGVYSEAELKAQGFNDEQIKKFIDIAKMAESAATEVKTRTQLWDVLKETAQSGWTQSWEYVIGDFETAKADLSKVQNVLSDILNNMADARNNLLKAWSDAGGRDDLVASVVNIFNAVKSIVIPIKEAFRDIFPPTTVDQLLKLTSGIKNFTAGLKLSDTASAKLKSTFRGLFAAVDIVWKIFKAVFTALKPIVGLFGEITGGVLGATGSFGEWIVALNDFIDKSGILTNVAEGIAFVFKQMLDFAKKYLTPFIEGIQNGFSRLVGGASEMKDGVVGAVNDLGSAIQSSSFFKVLNGLWKIISSVAGAISRIFGSAVGRLMDTLAGADFSKLLDFFNTLSLGTIAVAIAGLFKNTEGLLGTFIDFVDDCEDSIVSILDSVKGCLEAWQTSIKANALLKIAAAVGILAVSLLLLASIDSIKLTTALGAITTLFAELMGSMAIFTKLTLTTDLAKSTWALVAFSTAILLLAFALRTAAGADIDNMIVAGGAIVGLMFAMVGVAKLLGSKKEQATVISGTTAMVGFAAAIYVLAKALRLIADADIDNMIVALISIGSLMAAMVGVAKLLGTPGEVQLSVAAGGMIGFAAAIFILAAGLRMIAELDLAQIGIGLLGIVPLMAGLMGVSLLLSKNAVSLTGAGLGLIFFAGAVDLLVIGVKELGKMKLDELAKGVGAIAVLIGAMTGFAAVVKSASGSMILTGVAMVPMATAMIIFAEAVEKFGSMDMPTLGKGFGSLAIGLASMMGVLALLGSIGGSKVMLAAAAIAAVAGALVVMTVPFLLFQKLDWGTVIMTLTALGVTLLLIAAAVAGVVATGGSALAVVWGVAGALAVVGLSVLEFGAGVFLIASSFTMFGIGLTAIAVGIEAIAMAMPVVAENFFKTINIIMDGIASFGPNAGASLARGISIMCQAIVLSAEDIAYTVCTLVDEVALALLDIIPNLAETLFKILDECMVVLIQYVPQLTERLIDLFIALFDTLSIKMPELNESITNFVMSLFESLIEIFNNLDFRVVLDGLGALTAITLILASFVYLAVPAIYGLAALAQVVIYLGYVLTILGLLYKIPFVDDLIASGGDFLGAIGTALGQFVGGIAGGIAAGAAKSLPSIGESLSEFMVALKPFLDGMANVDESTMNSIKTLASAILVITAANVVDSLTSWLTGGSSMVDFGKQLAAFGPYFKKYYDSIKGIDGTVVESSANAAKTLSEMASNLPNSGGLVAWISGDNTLAKFAEELCLFGPSLKKYADSVTGLDANVVTNSVNAAKSISEMASNLPNSGGLVSWITGDNSLSRFASELMLFGPSLKAYADSIAGLDGGVVEASANAAKTIAEMAAIVPNMGGIKALWEGDNTLSKFGSELVLFGPFMKQYSDSVSGLKINVVSTSASAAKTLADMAHTVSNGKTSGLISFGTSLAGFGSNFKKYVDALQGVSVDKINAANVALREIMNISKLIAEANASGLESVGTALSKFAASSIDDFLNVFTSAQPKATQAAADMVKSLIEGFKSSHEVVVAAFDEIVYKILTAANDQYDDFYTAGGYLVEGFATGISEKTWMAEAKSAAMAKAALAAAKAALDEHSPSKEAYKIGAFAGEGFVNAFSDYESKSYDAGYSIADSAKRGLSYAVSKINDFINKDLDTQPTIRPVFDLSDLKSGAGAIGDMIGVGTSVGVMTNVGSIPSIMNRRNQNGANSDVVTAINKLRGELGNISKPSYNINGITYDSGSDIADAIETLVRATTIEGRV